MAIVVEAQRQRVYMAPHGKDEAIEASAQPEWDLRTMMK